MTQLGGAVCWRLCLFTPGRKRPVCIPCRVWYNGCITQEKSGGEGMAEILVVDDEAAIADLVEVCLKMRATQCTSAAAGRRR